MIIYKYVVADRIDILQDGKIRFSQVEALNDPYEVKPSTYAHRSEGYKELRKLFSWTKDFKDYSPLAVEIIVQESINRGCDEFLKIFNELLTLSLTQKRNNLLMWSHYTNSHQGFVIGFDSEHLYFQQHAEFPTTKLFKVRYSKTRSRLHRFELPDRRYAFDPNFKGLPLRQDILNNFIKILTTKSEHWKYEEELRMFAHADQGKIAKRVSGLDVYLYKFPKECVREVIFGLLMPEDKKQEIVRIVETGYPNCELFQAKLRDDIFDLRIKPYKA